MAEVLQGFFDIFHARGKFRWNIGTQPLRLRQRPGNGGAQFMGAVGGKFPLRLDCRSQPSEKEIDRTGDGMEFGRKGLCFQRCKIAAVLSADLVAKGLYGLQGSAHDDDDGEDAGGDED